MDEIMAAREAYNRFEISNVGLVSGSSNPADGLKNREYLYRWISYWTGELTIQMQRMDLQRGLENVMFDLSLLRDCGIMSALLDPEQFQIWHAYEIMIALRDSRRFLIWHEDKLYW